MNFLKSFVNEIEDMPLLFRLATFLATGLAIILAIILLIKAILNGVLLYFLIPFGVGYLFLLYFKKRL